MDVRMGSRLGYVVGVLLMIAVLLGCSSGGEDVKGSSTAGHRPASALRPVRWKISGKPDGRMLRIRSDVGYCSGSPKPYIKRVRSDEHGRKVLLTAMLTVVTRSTDVACAGVRLGVSKTVMLRRDVAGRAIYDASVSPPRRRWPR